MGRIVLGEEKIFPELVRLGKTEGYVPGLIIGQCSGQKDFIVHLAKTPLPAEKVNKLGNDISGDNRKIQKKSVEKISDIQESLLIDHANQVTRMLPGGMWILGLFITGPGDIFLDSGAQAKVSSLIQGLSKALSKNPNLYGNSPTSEKLALHLISGTNKFVCKSLDVTSSVVQFRAVDCKFITDLKWHELESQYDFELYPLHLISSQMSNQPLKKHLQDIVGMVNKGVHESLCTIEGEVRKDEDMLEVADSKSTKEDSKSKKNKKFHVNLFIPGKEDSNLDLSVTTVMEEMKCTGVLASRVYLHQKATIAEAMKAIKEDIIRSFASRIEMHCDSLVEEEIGSPEEIMVVHEPPRRVLIPLPHSRVALSDYLFPGEGPSEALASILELIGVKVSENAVYKDFEGQPDQSDLYNLTKGADTPKHEDSSASSSSHSLFLFIGIVLAFVILIASIIIQFYLK